MELIKLAIIVFFLSLNVGLFVRLTSSGINPGSATKYLLAFYLIPLSALVVINQNIKHKTRLLHEYQEHLNTLTDEEYEKFKKQHDSKLKIVISTIIILFQFRLVVDLFVEMAKEREEKRKIKYNSTRRDSAILEDMPGIFNKLHA
jgi:hypothetical protein